MARIPDLMKTVAAVVCASLLVAACGHSSKRSSTTTSTRATAPTTTTRGGPATTLVAATTAPPKSALTIQLGDKDSGRSIPVHLGDTIVLTLTDCFSCGYQWNITTASDGAVVAHRSTDDHQAQNAPGQVGGSGTRVFTLAAVGPGTTRLELGYFPPAKGAKAETTYALTFVVS